MVGFGYDEFPTLTSLAGTELFAADTHNSGGSVPQTVGITTNQIASFATQLASSTTRLRTNPVKISTFGDSTATMGSGSGCKWSRNSAWYDYFDKWNG